ncbi:hypothetical protein DRN97_05955 [Methanosarcinales archaeon]|nr:MAG: hypothetical protein DRN97_05955 [Methanosarcinales archaeon]
MGRSNGSAEGGEEIVKMDAIRITEVVKELIRLLQDMSEHGGGYDGKIVERVESEVDKLKEELGSWFIDDFEIYQAS